MPRSVIVVPPAKITLEYGTATLLPMLVITAVHSRFRTGRMIPTRKTEDLLLGSWELIQQLGGSRGGCSGTTNRASVTFMGTLATKLVLLPPRDPESKGAVERRNGWFEKSFMLGRSFTSPADFNAQFTDWLQRAYARIVRTTKASPIDRLEADRVSAP